MSNSVTGPGRSVSDLREPRAKRGAGGIDRAGLWEIGEVSSGRQAYLGKRGHQPSRREIVADQRGRPHRDAQAIDRSLNREVEVIERQRRRRLQA